MTSREPSDFFIVSGAASGYPLGNGGSTAVGGGSIFASSGTGTRHLLLESAHFNDPTANATLTIKDHAGTAIHVLSTSAGAVETEEVHFGHKGIHLINGIMMTVSSATGTALCVFRDLRPPS